MNALSCVAFSYDIPIFPADGLQEDRTVYDGVVLMKDNSKVYKKVWAQFKSTFLNYTSAKEEQLSFGVQAMFPIWTNELKKGNTVEGLCNWISSVQSHQCERISGYPKYISAHTPTYYSAQSLIDKVSTCLETFFGMVSLSGYFC